MVMQLAYLANANIS